MTRLAFPALSLPTLQPKKPVSAPSFGKAAAPLPAPLQEALPGIQQRGGQLLNGLKAIAQNLFSKGSHQAERVASNPKPLMRILASGIQSFAQYFMFGMAIDAGENTMNGVLGRLFHR